jgi:acyl-CoA dehydrogenase family protein 9
MAGPAKDLDAVSRAIREPIKGFGLLGDFALRRARSALGRERLSWVHPLLQREAGVFEHYVAELGRNVERVVRRHADQLHERQFTQARVADTVVDLYALAAVLSRATSAIALRGEEGARREVDLCMLFAAAAEARLAATAAAFDTNQDALKKTIAARTSSDGGYPLDIF